MNDYLAQALLVHLGQQSLPQTGGHCERPVGIFGLMPFIILINQQDSGYVYKM